jgi:hypothetical protein
MAASQAAYVALGILLVPIGYMDVKEAGRRGGEKRAKKMTPEERSKAARRAVMVRWAKDRDEKAQTATAGKKLSPEQRSAEMKQRAKVRAKNRKKGK